MDGARGLAVLDSRRGILYRGGLVVERGWLVKTSSGKVGRNLSREKYLAQFRPEQVP
jgi:hypothetical protein